MRLLLALALGAAALAVAAAAEARPGKHERRQRCAAPARKAHGHAPRARCARLSPRHARRPRERLVDLLAPGRPPAPPGTNPPSGPGPAPATLANVGVTAKEFALQLSRPAVAAGPVRFSVRNGGEDPHDLRVRPEGSGSALVSFPTLLPGDTDRATTQLAAGRYVLWCSLEGHEALGMSATLSVH